MRLGYHDPVYDVSAAVAVGYHDPMYSPDGGQGVSDSQPVATVAVPAPVNWWAIGAAALLALVLTR